jgi:hypothetical protein
MSIFSTVKSRLDTERLRVFGDDITYTPVVGDPQVVRMTRTRPAQMDPVEVGRYVIRWAPLSSFAVAPAKGAQMSIDGATYKVFELRYDEYGGVFLIANR